MNIEQRVQAIQDAKRMTVGEVLDYLQISAPMWSMIRARERDPTGKAGRSPSIKTIRRIEMAETDAGLRGGRVVREVQGVYSPSPLSVKMLEDMGSIKNQLDQLSKQVDDFIKRYEKGGLE